MDVDVDTDRGRLRGTAREGHVAFRGVPFAAPPAGDRRFLAPQPVAPWAGVREATTPGNAAPQDPFVPRSFRARQPASEDCLHLDVYTPAADGGKRPVLFWVHGGGFSHGSGSQPHYDGGPLAERGDVVVVSTNYRLGALGYLYLGGHGGAGWGAAANAGQLDQVAALRWVHDNIAAFGGDPANVTIFGQSAGAVAVHTLLAMPAADGLVAKAIAQSGTAARLGGTAAATAVTDRFLARLGIPPDAPEAVRTAPVDAMLQAQGARGALAPVVDGDTLPRRPVEAVRDGAARTIPLLVGTTRDEHKLYVTDRSPIDGAELRRQVAGFLPRRAADRVEDVIDTYRRSRRERGLPAADHDIVDAVATASRFGVPADRLCDDQHAHQPRTFRYRFDAESPARGGTLGACHGLEIPFVFGTIGRTGDDRLTGDDEAAHRLSHVMMDAWVAFARHGDPAHDGTGPWPPHDPHRRPTMAFGPDTGVEDAPFAEERLLWDEMTTAPAR